MMMLLKSCQPRGDGVAVEIEGYGSDGQAEGCSEADRDHREAWLHGL